MSPSPFSFGEHAIRLAAMRWLRNRVAIEGPELPWTALLQGFRHGGERIPLVNQRGIWKPRQMELPLSIRTSPKDPYGDRFDSVGDTLEYRYFGTDPDHADNRGLRRLIDEQRPLIWMQGVRPGVYLAIWPVFVVGDEPDRLTFRIVADDPEFATGPLSAGDQVAEVGARHIERRYATRAVRQRIHQRAFRSRVLLAYRDQCSMCRLRRAVLLDAAHIVGDREPEGTAEVPNALSLCKIHHTAFDKLLLGVTPKGVIQVRRDVLTEIDGPMLRYGIQELHEQLIQRPARAADHPDPDKLAVRYREFLAAS